MLKVRQSDPKVQKYLEVQFVDSPKEIYLRYKDDAYNPPWNSALWYTAKHGDWYVCTQYTSEILEIKYQACLKQS